VSVAQLSTWELILMLEVIPYVEPKEDKPSDFSSTFTSTMPMAAVSTYSYLKGGLS
jgi:hypothetical protein